MSATPGDRTLINRELHDLLVFKKGGFPFGESGFRISPENIHAVRSSFRFSFVVRMIHVIGIGNAIIGIKPVGGGKHFLMMTKMPFTKTSGGVPEGLKMVTHGEFIWI